jgi:integrase
VDEGARKIVEDWVSYLRGVQLWNGDDPVFPATAVREGAAGHFEAVSLTREHWSSSAPIRDLFRAAFRAAGLPYFNPHSFRKTLALAGERQCQTPEEFKAWSQNLGHESVLTTFRSYGSVSEHRQAEIIQSLGTAKREENNSADQIAEAVFRKMNAMRQSPI